MKVRLVSIGNSKGVRIPASVIKECGLGNELEMRVEKGVIVTRRHPSPYAVLLQTTAAGEAC